jgi:hypothetical protein
MRDAAPSVGGWPGGVGMKRCRLNFADVDLSSKSAHVDWHRWSTQWQHGLIDALRQLPGVDFHDRRRAV